MTTTPSNPASRKSTSGTAGQAVAELPVLFRVPKVALSGLATGPGAPIDHTGKGSAKETIPLASPATAGQSLLATVTKDVAAEATPVKKSEEPPAAAASVPVPTSGTRTPARPKAKEGSWFDNQGKLITVCFLLALAATIYFARSKRQENDPQPLADLPALDVSVPDLKSSTGADNSNDWQAPEEIKPRTKPARNVDAARRRVAEAAQNAENSDTAPRADLLPPMDLKAPPLVSTPKDDTNKPPVPPADLNEKPAEARVAEVPTERRTTRAGSWGGAAELPAPSTETTSPPATYPAATAAPTTPGEASYPTTNAAPYRYYMPPTQPGATPPPSGTPNYERTGSGLY